MPLIVLDRALGADYHTTIAPALAKLAALSPSVATWAPTPDVYTQVMNGTAKIGVGWNAFAQYYHDVSKGRLGVAVPAEGTIFQVNTINFVARGPHPKEALDFINYALSPEAQTALSEVMFYAPTNKKAVLPEAVLHRTAAAPEVREKMMPLDWTAFVANRTKWAEEWRRQVLTAH